MIKTLLKVALLCSCCSSLNTYAQTQLDEITAATVQRLEPGDSQARIVEKAAKVLPSPRQLAYHQREYSAFIHFGPNTFTGVEWGSGIEEPAVFNPVNVDTKQWCETIHKAGMKTAILTVKHHDGFVLYQSRYTSHGVMSSPYMHGKADILRMLVDSCRALGIKIGVYLSPADLYQMESEQGLYGNESDYSERIIPKSVAGRPFADKRTFVVKVDDYNEYFMSQLFELLTEYGPIHEVWFDGAHPKRKGGQQYKRQQWYKLIRALAPEAIIFGGPDARWVGNEQGFTRKSEWSVIPVKKGQPHLDRPAEDLGSRARLFEPGFKVYGDTYPSEQLRYIVSEVDTSIRDGWFYRDDHRQQVRSADDIFDIYERTVGGNAVFLLNIPPNREGKFSTRDVEALIDSGNRIKQTYSENLLSDAHFPAALQNNGSGLWQTTDEVRSFEIQLPTAINLNRFVLQEAIASHGQRIEEHALDAWIDNQWQEIARGTTVGYKKILRFQQIRTHKLRVRIPQSRLQATISRVAAHYAPVYPPKLDIVQTTSGKVEIQVQANDFSFATGFVLNNRWLAEIAWFFGLPATLAPDEPQKKSQMHNRKIYYTIDGTEPTAQDKLYQAPLALSRGKVKARVFQGEYAGPISVLELKLNSSNWQLLSVSSEQPGPWYQLGIPSDSAANAFDNDPDTYWQSDTTTSDAFQHLAIDFGSTQTLSAFTYLPRQNHASGEGAIESGDLEISRDGKSWEKVDSFTFGNIVNDPSQRTHYFQQALKTRYIRLLITRGAKATPFAGAAEIGFLAY